MLQRNSSRALSARTSLTRSAILIGAIGFSAGFVFVHRTNADSLTALQGNIGAISGFQGSADFSETNTSSGTTVTLNVSVDYAVFAPGSLTSVAALGTAQSLTYSNYFGQLGTGGSSFNPSPNDFVYAYQILNDSDSNVPVGLASIGYEPSLWTRDSKGNLVSPISSVGQINASSGSAAAIFASVDQATTNSSGGIIGGDATAFSFSGINPNQSSYILLVSSPFSPVLDNVQFGSYFTGGGIGPGGAGLDGPASDIPIPMGVGGNGGVSTPLPSPWIASAVLLAIIPFFRFMKRMLPAIKSGNPLGSLR